MLDSSATKSGGACARARVAPTPRERDAHLEKRVHAERVPRTIGKPAEQGASQRESREETADSRRHGVHVDADDKRQLLDPDRLVDERGDTRKEEESSGGGGDDRKKVRRSLVSQAYRSSCASARIFA